ncbi:MAG TPA: DNA-binding protein WhiA [Gaiellaceae bacterium]|nr:DNA-binding protein WhiA [Gaiellaceae bacterium]
MSLSEEVRSELAAITPRRECDRLAELSALFHSAGRLHLRGRGEVSLHLDLPSSAVARRAFSLLRGFGVPCEIRSYRRRAFGGETRYQLHVSGDTRAMQVLHEAGVVSARLTPLGRPPRRLVGRSCCRGAYLRGALLGSGSVSPAHLEIRTGDRRGAEFLADVAHAEGIKLHVHERGDHALAYAKGSEAIAELLAAAGAAGAVLTFVERGVVGAAKSRANRLANADHANLVRSSRAAGTQLRALRRLQRRGALARLPHELQELAELRLAHPSLSLRELGLKCRPPATKATVHRRLQKLIRLAEP